MSKAQTIKWAQANGVRFVFAQIDGFGRKVLLATNDDRRAEGQLTLVWAAQ